MIPTTPDAVSTSMASGRSANASRKRARAASSRSSHHAPPLWLIHRSYWTGSSESMANCSWLPRQAWNHAWSSQSSAAADSGSPVDEIADREQTIGGRIEADLVEQGAQVREHAVDVADHEIASGLVARVTRHDPPGAKLGRRQSGRQLAELHRGLVSSAGAPRHGLDPVPAGEARVQALAST